MQQLVSNYQDILMIISVLFILYLIFHSIYLLVITLKRIISLYENKKQRILKNRLNHDYYVPISILVPTYNNQDKVSKSIDSLLKVNYKLYEIVIIDDDSTDKTVESLVKKFHLQKIERPIRDQLKTKKIKEIYQSSNSDIKITLLKKEHGGKADTLNVGINASNYPYILPITIDYNLDENTLENLASSLLEEENVVITQGVVYVGSKIKKGKYEKFKFPKGILEKGQTLEYDKVSKKTLTELPSLVLFKKDIVVSVLGYDRKSIGENFELIEKIKNYSKVQEEEYVFKNTSTATCSLEVPNRISTFIKQRKRYIKGLLHVKSKIQYLFSILKLIGIISIITSCILNILNPEIILLFLGSYLLFCGCLSLCSFLINLTFTDTKLSFIGLLKSIVAMIMEVTVLKLLVFISNLTFFTAKRDN